MGERSWGQGPPHTARPQKSDGQADRDRLTDRQAGRQIGKQAGRHTDRQAGRLAGRQTDRRSYKTLLEFAWMLKSI